jgi:hypothetical protein
MSLTLARLCGEWRLVSKNCEARSGKYEARIVIFRILAADYFIAEYRNSWLKYKARIAIFCILAVEEIGKPLKKIFLDFSEIGKPLNR